MKKTVSISLASTPFIVEEDAYQALDKYLSEIKAHFSSTPDTAEVVTDIEARIAEQFIESGKQVISQAEVTKVIASMGSVHEFGDVNSERKNASGSETSNEQAQTETKKKRLYRNPDDKVIAGVASGIAAFFGTDAVWIRLAFIIFTLFNGFGVILYIAFWIATTEAKTASQRLEMSGTPVTVATLTERVKERVEEVKKNEGTFKRVITLPFKIIGGIVTFIVTKILPLIGKLLGIILSLASVAALFTLSIAFGLLITNTGGEYIDFPIQAVVSTGIIVIAAISAYIALAIPFLLLLTLGNLITFKRRMVSGAAMLGLLGVWFIAVVIGVVTGFSIGGKVAAYVATSPEYRQKTVALEALSPFTHIVVQNGAHVNYVQSTSTSVAISGRAKDLEHISITSINGVLNIEPKREDHERFCIFCDFGVPHVEITAPRVNHFEGRNGVSFEGQGITVASTTILLSNGAHGVFKIQAQHLSADIKNAVHLELSGHADSVNIAGTNGTHTNATEFTAREAMIDVSNASEVDIGATEILNAKARNGAEINYAGTPLVTKEARNGAEIRGKDDDSSYQEF